MSRAVRTPPDLAVEIGRRVKELRESAGLRQIDVAECVGLRGPSAIAHVEQGANSRGRPHSVSLRLLIALADAFDVTTDYLLGREERR